MLNKGKISIILRFVVSFGLLVALIWIMRKDAKSIWAILKNSNKIFFIVGLAINIPLAIALAYRLKLLMSGQKIKLPMNDAIYLTFIGYFFNNFLPTAIGGDIAKAYYASKQTNNKAASYAAVLIDRILGFISTLLIAVIGIVFIWKEMNNGFIVWLVLMTFILSLICMFFLLKKKAGDAQITANNSGLVSNIKEKISKLYTAINLYRDSSGILIKAIILSLILQSMSILSIYFFALSIGGGIHLLRLFLIIPLVWAVSMLPSLNGLGVREGAFIYFLKSHIGTEKAFALSLLWLGMIMLYSAVGGIFHLLYPVKAKT
jgi:uncharacterized protein (TIRG00374 family)